MIVSRITKYRYTFIDTIISALDLGTKQITNISIKICRALFLEK